MMLYSCTHNCGNCGRQGINSYMQAAAVFLVCWKVIISDRLSRVLK